MKSSFTAVASAFDAGRGLAMGLTLSGSALAQAITPPLTPLNNAPVSERSLSPYDVGHGQPPS